MTPQAIKTAAFLNKIAAEERPGFWNSNWFGLGDQSSAAPFTQPASESGGEAPGLASNYWEALKRGHTGTVAATGGAALLAGVLAYNLLKKKTKGIKP